MAHWRRQYLPPDRIPMIVHGTVNTVALVVYLVAFVAVIVAIFAVTPKAKAAPACQQGQIAGIAELAKELGVKSSTSQSLVAQGCDGKSYDVVELIRAHVALMRKARK